MSNVSWYVIQSKPNKEGQVAAYLEAQAIEVFYPTMKVKPVNPRSSTIRPYFPRYMFVHVDLEAIGISTLRWVPGAIGLVHFDGYASPVPDPVVYEVKKRVSQIEDAGGLLFDGLQRGDQIRITSGPLAGYDAIFDMRLSGSERVQVLLEMLGRQVRAQVDIGMIERPRRRDRSSNYH